MKERNRKTFTVRKASTSQSTLVRGESDTEWKARQTRHWRGYD